MPLKSDLVGPVSPLLLLLVTAVLFVLLIAGVTSRTCCWRARAAAPPKSRFAPPSAPAAAVRPAVSDREPDPGGGRRRAGNLDRVCRDPGRVDPAAGCLLPRAEDIRVDERVLVFTTSRPSSPACSSGWFPPSKRPASISRRAERTGTALGRRPPSRPGSLRDRPGGARARPAGGGGADDSQPDHGAEHRSRIRCRESAGGTRVVPRRGRPARPDPRHVAADEPAVRVHTGIEAASLSASSVPMTPDFSTLPFWLDGQAKPSTQAAMNWALTYIVDADYLEVMGIPLRRGRFLTPHDHERSSPVIVIDDQFARRHFGNQDPIGRRVHFDIVNITAEIVGVVGHVRQRASTRTRRRRFRHSSISRCSRFRIMSCRSPLGTSPWCSGRPTRRSRRWDRFDGRCTGQWPDGHVPRAADGRGHVGPAGSHAGFR